MARKTYKLFPATRACHMSLVVAACFSGSLYADVLPVNPNVVAGSATFSQTGNVLNITNSNGAVINWQQFNVGAGNTVNFLQSSASSSVLNRVISQDPSQILGNISSNGRVWLINTNGILVGQGARIDVAGFVASTLNISDANFIAGKYLFDATPGAGSVVNQGSITTTTGGTVYLVAPEVRNEGIITTPGGETLLAAGQSVQLVDTATPGVKVEITGSEGKATNLGTILADAGRIGMAGVLVKNSGTLNASSVVNEGGRIFLKASQDAYVDGNGRIVTTGAKGGQVEVLGNRVAVMDNASIDASGTSGGGSILVGGDYQGKNADVQNSQITYLGANASLKADATVKGNGGKVIMWADNITRAYGNISARGGALGGNGGFVETSGKQYLDVTRAANVGANNGLGGTWLLDPTDITIFHSASASDVNISGSSPFQAPSGNSSQLSDYTINAALASGGNVQIQTSSSGSANGDIKFDGSSSGAVVISYGGSASASLTLVADRDIKFDSGSTIFQTTGTGNFSVVFNPANNQKVEIASGATATFYGGSGGSIIAAINPAGPNTKTWENYGTLNLSGNSAIDLETGGYFTDFNNKSTGVVNITSSAGWSFISRPSDQDGVINNAGVINANGTSSGNYDAWEVKYSQAAGGVLNVGAGKTLSMQNADVIYGGVNIGSGGILRLSETHYGANTFYGTTITGPGILDTQVATTFYGATLSGATLANSIGSLTIPSGITTYSGNVGFAAYNNLIFASGVDVVVPGNLNLVAGWDGSSSLTSPTLGSGTGNITITDALVKAGGNVSVVAKGNLEVSYVNRTSNQWSLPTAFSSTITDTYGGAALAAAGNMTATIYGDLLLYNQNGASDQISGSGSSGRYVALAAQGTQTITMAGTSSNISLDAQYGGASYGGAVFLASLGNQTINFGSGSHALTVQAGSGLSSGQRAKILTQGVQTIDGTTAGGTLAVAVYGGSPSAAQNKWYMTDNSGNVICVDCVAGAEAAIRSDSWATTAQTIKATSLSLKGGSVSNGNGAYVEAHGGQNITVTNGISVTGGDTAGAYYATYYGGTFSSNGTWSSNSYYGASIATGMEGYAGNEAGISSKTKVTINAGTVTLNGGTANVGSAFIGSPVVDITTTGNVLIQAGSAIAGTGSLSAGQLPTGFHWQNTAAIGWDEGTADITINAGGTVTLTGGSAWSDTGSLAMIGGVNGAAADVKVTGTSISLSGTSNYSARIGSSRSTGSVELHATSGTITETEAGFIGTADLTATATGSIGLESMGNQVGLLTATSTSGNISFYGDSVDLHAVSALGGGVTIQTTGAIRETDVGTYDIEAGTGGVSLTSLYGGSSGGLAISADIESAGAVTATVNNTATYGGIRIGITEAPANGVTYTLHDYASYGASASLYNYAGALDLATNRVLMSAGSAGDIFLGASGNLTLNAATASDLSFSTSGDVMVVAGGTLSFGANKYLANSGTVTMVAGTLDMTAANVQVTGTNGFIGVVAGNATISSGSWIRTYNEDLNLLVGGNLTISNGAYLHAGYNPTAGKVPDASILVGGDLRLNNGAYIKAYNDVYLDLVGANSTLYLNDTAGLTASGVWSDVGMPVGTTYLSFLSRSSGGVVIDGSGANKTAAGTSGFFAGSSKAVASAGNGLSVTYGVQDNVVATLLTTTNNNATTNNNLSGNSTNNVVPVTTGGGSGNTSPNGQTTGGGDSNSFGSNDPSANNSSGDGSKGSGDDDTSKGSDNNSKSSKPKSKPKKC